MAPELGRRQHALGLSLLRCRDAWEARACVPPDTTGVNLWRKGGPSHLETPEGNTSRNGRVRHVLGAPQAAPLAQCTRGEEGRRGDARAVDVVADQKESAVVHEAACESHE